MPRKLNWLVVVGILAIGWAFWQYRLGANDHDDMLANELLFAGQGLPVLLFRIPWPDQSPFYFLYLRVLTIFGGSPLVVQLANAVLLTATLIATYRLAIRLSSSRVVGSAALFLGAISPASLWLVRNGRMYSLQLLFSVLACVFVLRIMEDWRPRDLAAFAVLCLLNIYTHFVGFLTTLLLLVPLAADVWLGARTGGRWTDGARRPARWLALTAAVIGLLALPQIVRLAFLVTHPTPARAEVSLPVLSHGFVQRVGWFWFINADWGSLRLAERTVTAIYAGSIITLSLAGVLALRLRRGLILALWIVVPLATIGLAAAHVDVRDRYFAWTLPILWVATATGALAALPWTWLAGARADVARGVRGALLVAVAATSVWLLWHKLPERFAEWDKLMSALEPIYQPSMVVYMPPGSPIGMPRVVAKQRNMPAGLQHVRELSAGTHAEFLDEVAHGRDFVFLVYDIHENAEMQWRVRYLTDRGYRQAIAPVYGAVAHVFTRSDANTWSREQRLAGVASPQSIADWARTQIRDRPASGASPDLAKALVARVQPDGIAHVGRIFVTQHGEYGLWKLGPQAWDAVEEVRSSSGKVERDMIAAHPMSDSMLVVAFPALATKKSLEISYGIADTGLRFRAGAPVDVDVYLNGTPTLAFTCPNTPGWKTVVADTSALAGKTADVVLLVATRDDTSRHFAFALKPSSRPVPASAGNSPESPAIALIGGGKLSDAVANLLVYRTREGQRLDAQHDGRTYAAADMHEDTRFNDSGAVRRVWALGPLLWDAVGWTRQRSGGEARDGLWAHPRAGTTLVIETPKATVDRVVRGFLGLTDFSVYQAQVRDVTSPVTFTLLIDGRAVFTHDTPRASGWTAFAVPVDGRPREHSLKIEISAQKDSWAHFVFDLWSE